MKEKVRKHLRIYPVGWGFLKFFGDTGEEGSLELREFTWAVSSAG